MEQIWRNAGRIIGAFRGKGALLEQRSFKITTDYTANVHKEGKNTDAILSILYDFSKLEETERHWLVNMALLPATNRTLVFLVGLFTPDDKYAFGEILGHLAEKGWLISEEDGYRISPVIQQLALKNTRPPCGMMERPWEENYPIYYGLNKTKIISPQNFSGSL